MTSGAQVPVASVKGTSVSSATAGTDQELATLVPAGYLDVAGLDFVPWQELADRHAWLLDAIKSARPGPDVRLPGIRAAALALVAVLAELDLRARGYEAAADHRYWCSCGFVCQGLAAFDAHMDYYPPGEPGTGEHAEVSEESLEQEAEAHSPAPRRLPKGQVK
jgi:hypothetical protein